MADRWLPDLPDDRPDMCQVYAAMFDEECAPELKEQYRDFCPESLSKRNTSVADYVWLPVVFEGDIPKIYWHDEWRIEDYE